jgi:hypothetical protein
MTSVFSFAAHLPLEDDKAYKNPKLHLVIIKTTKNSPQTSNESISHAFFQGMLTEKEGLTTFALLS